MVRRKLQNQNDDTVKMTVEDVSPDLVTNWCEHIRIKQENVSPLGQMIGLPIGLKSVECPYFHGHMAMTLSRVAPSFIEQHCHGCPHHKEIHPNNIGREIIARVAARKEREARITEAGVELERLRPNDPARVLAADPDSDETVKELVGLLADDVQKRRAASTLLEAAKYRPQLFTRTATKAMQAALLDPDVGSQVIEVLRVVGTHDREVLHEAAELAPVVIEREVNEGAAAQLLVDAIEQAALEPQPELTKVLIDALPVPGSLYERLSGGKPKQGVRDAARRLGVLRFELLADAARERLESTAPYARAKGAHAARLLVDIDVDRAIAVVLDHLIGALALEDDMEVLADGAIRETLALMLRKRSEPVAEELFAAAERADPEVGSTILGVFRYEEALGNTAPSWLPRLVRSLSEEHFDFEQKQTIVEGLSRMVRIKPQWLAPFVEQLLGAMTTICRQYDVRSAQTLAGEDPLAYLERSGDLSTLRFLLRHIREVIVDVSADGLDDIISQLSDLLANTPTGIAATFKSEILTLVGDIGERYAASRTELIPLIFPHLDPASPAVRASAASACADLVQRRSDTLPDDTLTVLAGLLADEYLGPVYGAVRVFRVALVPDERLAFAIANRLAIVYDAYRENGVGKADLLYSAGTALRNLAEQHSALVPYAAQVLVNGTNHEYRYLAKDCLEGLGWFVKQHATYQEQYIASLASYYRRFRSSVNEPQTSNGGELSTVKDPAGPDLRPQPVA